MTFHTDYDEELELLEKQDPKNFTRIPDPNNKSEFRKKLVRTPQLNRLYDVMNNRLARIVFNSGVQNFIARVKNLNIEYDDILERYVIRFQVDFFSRQRWSRRVCTIYVEHRGISISPQYNFRKEEYGPVVRAVAMELEKLLYYVDVFFSRIPKPSSTKVSSVELDKSPVL